MNNSNFIVAVVLSVAILIGFQYLYERPRQEAWRQQQLIQAQTDSIKPAAAVATAPAKPRARAEILAQTPRIPVRAPEFEGSINLRGARLDDLHLVNYREAVDPSSPRITLLSPAGSDAPNTAYYGEFGWLGAEGATPGPTTLWEADGKELTPAKPVTLRWNNGQGLRFETVFEVDESFMFTVTSRVFNATGATATLYPFGLVARHGKPKTDDIYILHEGPLGAFNGTLQEHKYKDLMDKGRIVEESEGGWIGLTDKYWLVALVPDSKDKITGTFAYERGADPDPEKGFFQSDLRGTPVLVGQGASASHTQHFFAGAKRLRVLDGYESRYNIPRFDQAIDFGWYYFLTKPFLYLLDFFGHALGNLGWAIVVFTILLKLLTLPLSMKSYRAMARMKALQPQMQALQERFKDDKQRLSLEMMEFYKREKVNPMSGCLPNLIQIPIFFALYKVLYVGIEMRHAPLFGWVHDLSAPDPTSVLSLFGLIDWAFIPHVGVWPVLMGLSMYAQQKLSPQPPDKTQAQIFLILPILFTFLLANMSAGLVFYWTFSNVIGIAQQAWIQRRIAKRPA